MTNNFLFLNSDEQDHQTLDDVIIEVVTKDNIVRALINKNRTEWLDLFYITNPRWTGYRQDYLFKVVAYRSIANNLTRELYENHNG